MKYQKGYKYKLLTTEQILIPFADSFVNKDITRGNEWVYVEGKHLIIKAGYAWNGANIIPDTKKVIYPSLIHDAWYQLLREGHVPHWTRTQADMWFGNLCHLRGTCRLLAGIYTVALGAFAERPSIQDRRPIITVK